MFERRVPIFYNVKSRHRFDRSISLLLANRCQNLGPFPETVCCNSKIILESSVVIDESKNQV